MATISTISLASTTSGITVSTSLFNNDGYTESYIDDYVGFGADVSNSTGEAISFKPIFAIYDNNYVLKDVRL